MSLPLSYFRTSAIVWVWIQRRNNLFHDHRQTIQNDHYFIKAIINIEWWLGFSVLILQTLVINFTSSNDISFVWINFFVITHTTITLLLWNKIEECASGAVACQLIQIHKTAFDKKRIRKYIDVDKLIREFCQWLKAFFDTFHCDTNLTRTIIAIDTNTRPSPIFLIVLEFHLRTRLWWMYWVYPKMVRKLAVTLIIQLHWISHFLG